MEEPFYKDGLCFECQRCSGCCRFDSGYVFLSYEDLDRLAAKLGMSRDEFLEKYTKSYKLKQVKTSNMGSLYKLSYEIVLTDPSIEKEFIDQLRTRNGNLEISLAEYQMQNADQL